MKKLLLACLLPALFAGCSGPTFTMAELGHPVFESVVGKDTRFERADPNQKGNLDAFPDTASKSADHRFLVSFLPAASEAKIGVEVRAHVKGKLGFKRLVAAAYPMSRQEAATFSSSGEIPAGAPLLGLETESHEDEAGWRVLHLIFESSKLPPGTEMLAVPTLAQFKDGWISIRFYTSRVPEPLRMLSPEEIEAYRKKKTGGAPAPTPEPPPAKEGEAPKEKP